MTILRTISQTWREPTIYPISEEFRQAVNLPEIVLQSLIKRGFSNPDDALAFLDPQFFKPSSPFDLPDLEKGVDRVLKAIAKKEKIGVWGDFDVDGQTSTAILVSTLRQLGADVSYHVPIRAVESHGIQLRALKEFLKTGVSLIITCDTGISANASIGYAQSVGIDVIVTDHHALPDVLPPAFALINPQRLENTHPMRSVPGVGTAFKFSEALVSHSDKANLVQPAMDLAALGIIADLAELRGDARYLVQSGLAQIRRSPRPALRALLEANEVNFSQLTEEHVSFILAPRLNAIGRLSDANPMVEFLLSEDPEFIKVTVAQLEGLNAHRKVLCDQVFQGAVSQIEKNPSILDDPIIMLSHPEWPGGVIGIAASRLTNLYHRPVILFVAPQNEPMRGSARSVEGINIISAINQHSPLLSTFGGHPMAAGLSLDPTQFREFQRSLNRTIGKMMVDNPVTETLEIDTYLDPALVDFETVDAIESLAPFGPGNPPFLFGARQLRLVDSLVVGKEKTHVQVTVENADGVVSKLIWWQGAGLPQPSGPFDLAFSARASDYHGKSQIQLEWIGFQQDESSIEINSTNVSSGINNLDLRMVKSPAETLHRLLSQETIQVWKEGTDSSEVTGLNSIELTMGKDIAIWTVPPNLSVLEEVILRCKPGKLFWFGILPFENDLQATLKTITKTIKECLPDEHPSIKPSDLAVKCATTTPVVEQVILWLAARGDISILGTQFESFSLAPGGARDPAAEIASQVKIKRLMDEIQAFRKYYLSVEFEHLTQKFHLD